ncbi:MAG: hypothetical protein HBSAPP03_08940 [Phycisphaerae bacterium]|nr:MAG: hypothetical protein HBSAPP03_08940 [Phycisphaerae bacterium]
MFACQTAPRQPAGPSPSDRFTGEASAIFGAPKAGSNAPADGGWKLLLAVAAAGADDIATMQLVGTVRMQTGLHAARLEKQGKVLAVTYGSYASATDESALAELRRIRTLEIDGRMPYAGAMLIPPAFEGSAVVGGEMDLATLKKRVGKRAAFTLQIAAYERADGKDALPEDLAEIRKAAEEAARRLRQDGDEAFYYHGPRRSMVTVGVFSEKEYDTTRPGRESPLLKLLREKYPFNLVNGAPIRVRTRANPEGVVQPSFVVAVPD